MKPLLSNGFMVSGAEREGFEPPEACTSTVFKTAAFDRSAISPAANIGWQRYFAKKLLGRHYILPSQICKEICFLALCQMM